MGDEGTLRIEASVDSAAAAAYAAATALVLYLLNASNAYVAVGTAVAFAGCLYGLRSIEPEYVDFRVGVFEPAEIETVELEELLLTDEVRRRLPTSDGEILVLDDLLVKIGPDSRVVRLFDPAAMPAADRLDRHLGEEEGTQSAPSDASQALHDALAQLRRSLR